MGKQKPITDVAYLDRKRRELTRLRDSLRKSSDAAAAEQSGLELESNMQAHEYEDDAQRLDMLEQEGNLAGRDLRRLARVERALEKITEGTYGLSDISGQRIPDERLDAMPEANNTVAEQAASERIG